MWATSGRRPALLPLRPSPLAVAFVLLLLVLASAAFSIPRAKRAASGGTAVSRSSDEVDTAKICHNSTPCGWAVYTRFTRNMISFVKNTCVCSRGRVCARSEDDVSVSAFVYRCIASEDQGTQQQTDG